MRKLYISSILIILLSLLSLDLTLESTTKLNNSPATTAANNTSGNGTAGNGTAGNGTMVNGTNTNETVV